MSTSVAGNKRRIRIATWSDIPDDQPVGAHIGALELVIIRRDGTAHVLYGRCLHRGALLSDGHVSGPDLICSVHGWDYRIDSGVSAYNNGERLERFPATIDGDELFVDADAVEDFCAATRSPIVMASTRAGSTAGPPRWNRTSTRCANWPPTD